ncbi:metallophosphoesterase [Rhizobium beringeri]
MKAWIFSDLHLEVNPTSPIIAIPDADVCICAGDIFTKGLKRSIKYLGDQVSPHMPVLFVPGNHEYWGSSLVEGLEEGIREAAKYPDVHILHRAFVHFGGFRFAGATFWSDLNLFNSIEMAMLHAKEGMNDFRRIMLSKKPFRRFSVRNSMQLHWEENAFIQSVLWHESALPLVVITHHAPSILSVPPEFIDDPVAPMFASRFEQHIIKISASTVGAWPPSQQKRLHDPKHPGRVQSIRLRERKGKRWTSTRPWSLILRPGRRTAWE